MLKAELQAAVGGLQGRFLHIGMGAIAPFLKSLFYSFTALKLRSRPLTLWVRAPKEMKSTPARA